MQHASAILITILCILITSVATAEEVSWNVRVSEDSPFARLAAVTDDVEIMSIACIKSDVTDAAIKKYGVSSGMILPQMMKNSSLAILVQEEPAEGKSVRLNLEYVSRGNLIARTQMGYVDDFGAFFTELRPAAGLIELLKEATALKFQKKRANAESIEVDFSGVFRNELASMAGEHCHTGVASAMGLAIGPVAQGSISEKIDWEPASDWPSKKGVFFLLRHREDNRLVTQLSDDSGQAVATLTALDEKLAADPHQDFLIDAGNRYFFRAPHNDNGRAVGTLTYAGELSLLTTEDSFALSLRDAVALHDSWILSAGGLFHLSANDELSDLSATSAPGRFPAHLINVGERVIYVDQHPEYGVELFATDGTADGTGLVLDINTHVYLQGQTRGSDPALEHAALINNRAVFTAIDESIPANSASGNYHIWSSDGTAEGTLRLPTDGFYSYFSDFIEFEDRLYVTARPRGTGDDVLYTTDGTPSGTRALASVQSLVKAAGGDPERVRSSIGEPTKVGDRLIVPLLGSPLGRERGNPLFEVSPNGELKQLSETSENIGDLSGRLRQTGISAGGKLLYSGVIRKKSTKFAGFETPTVIRSIDPDTGGITTLYELQTGEAMDWSPPLPQRLAAADAVVFGTRQGGNRNIIITDGTAAGTRSLSQIRLPKISSFAVGDRRIAWLEHDVFFSFDPSQAEVITLFDPATTEQSRPGNAILGTLQLH
jgi:ELWxxDGT repeat protein